MDIFEKIHVHGFRRLHSVDLKLKPLNVLIGANGCGKTSLLDVFTLLSASASASGELKSRINQYGGVDSNLSSLSAIVNGKARMIHIELFKPVEETSQLKYSISLTPSGTSYEISEEALIQYRDHLKKEPLIYIESNRGDVYYFDPEKKKLISPTWAYFPQQSALSQVPIMFREPQDFRKGLASSTHYHVLDVSSRAPVRLPQPMREAKLPGKQGEDLVSCLYWMREADPDRFEIIEDTLRVGFPNFERLNFPPVAAGTLAMTWKETGTTHPFFMHQLSEGTLRFLWLITLLYSPGLTEVTLLDEPEVSLHPELLSILADCMRDASNRTQLIVATHADRLVRFLKPEEVVTVDLEEDGTSTFTRADDLELDAWLKDYSLDEIWQHGRMGARP
ncbi:MAG: AAA family ATPase [Planctomycetaceae bacterium]|nr:AAA family ATPase [Planctomycetaceae bacterium]